jgi:hypothetical protein
MSAIGSIVEWDAQWILRDLVGELVREQEGLVETPEIVDAMHAIRVEVNFGSTSQQGTVVLACVCKGHPAEDTRS